jgi:hypothetical protein
LVRPTVLQASFSSSPGSSLKLPQQLALTTVALPSTEKTKVNLKRLNQGIDAGTKGTCKAQTLQHYVSAEVR